MISWLSSSKVLFYPSTSTKKNDNGFLKFYVPFNNKVLSGYSLNNAIDKLFK